MTSYVHQLKLDVSSADVYSNGMVSVISHSTHLLDSTSEPASLFFWNTPSFASPESSVPEINCLIINLVYVNCTWDDNGTQKYNYSFKSMFSGHETLECSNYHIYKYVNVGCMIPYKETQRFNLLSTWLYNDNGSLMIHQKHDLKDKVKLYPPYNLSVVERKDAELWLYWNVTGNNSLCTESQVRHRNDNKDWQIKTPSTKTSFSLPFPSKKQYKFQVRARVSASCGESKLWSDWSEPVFWGSLKPNNDTGPDTKSVTALVLYTVGTIIMLVILSCLLVQSERLRVILIPLVPNAGRNVNNYLADLFDNCDGNVENWLSISKDLEKAFKSNFTERACPVREYRIVSQLSSDSESVISIPKGMSSDYQCKQSYSSASTIPGPAENPQTQAPSQVYNPV
ncbi:cytokine receptor common subunit gamma-like isoform X2 [Xyrauchen texanus]|uniref:cytokine receptor common subunit gamma-like isoform X2 n=1 Tax=Xyrauchen texanus TaxID=154827 RepID=UPI002242A64F|nr:cytokine receptor common subunit gamma-like isoform X2 [Xyrauchen texanus]